MVSLPATPSPPAQSTCQAPPVPTAPCWQASTQARPATAYQPPSSTRESLEPHVQLLSTDEPHPYQKPASDQPQTEPASSTWRPPPTTSAAPPTVDRIPTSKRKKVLYVADSIGRNVDIRHLEEATNTMIYKEKAYGAEYKTDALKPNENFVYVSNNAASKRNYSYAVFHGSTTDVTNLDTSAGTESDLEYQKQEIFIASQNMISAARNIVQKYPEIEKVLILDRPPRFDPLSTDPAQLKPKLSEYGNKVLREELEKCDVKHKIFICPHSLPKEPQENLYGHPDRRGYDGIHFTRSVCNILQKHLDSHSREPHRQTIPRIAQPSSSGSRSSAATTSTLKPSAKSDSVVPETCTHNNFTYAVPTYNYFSALGN